MATLPREADISNLLNSMDEISDHLLAHKFYFLGNILKCDVALMREVIMFYNRYKIE